MTCSGPRRRVAAKSRRSTLASAARCRVSSGTEACASSTRRRRAATISPRRVPDKSTMLQLSALSDQLSAPATQSSRLSFRAKRGISLQSLNEPFRANVDELEKVTDPLTRLAPPSRKSRHSRASGNPLCSGFTKDPRFRGGDDACSFHSLGLVEGP
jgi:hypothetical protein